MIIKIGNFNFVSNKSEKIDLNEYNFTERLKYFYMTGKEDTLYVSDRSYFDNPNFKRDFEISLKNNYYILDYHMLISNRINDFIKEKTTKLYMNSNYSRYDLYSNLKLSDISKLEEIKIKFNCTEKITNADKLVYEIGSKHSLYFNPYSEKIENLEELYQEKFFDEEIKKSLILLELQRKKAPQYLAHIKEIQEFLKDKQTINLVFKNGDKIKVNASIIDIFDIRNYKINLAISKDYNINDLDKFVFNRTELKIHTDKFYNIKEQIIKTPADMLSFKIDDMKKKLTKQFDDYRTKYSYIMPSDLEFCISKINYIDENNKRIELQNKYDEKEVYPIWYTDGFIELWKQYGRIKTLENASCIEDIKDVAVETGDNELQKIYYILEGEELEEDIEEETNEI